MSTTYYVNPTVAVSGDGLSDATAKKLFREAYTAAVAGDTILLRSGMFHAPFNGFYSVIRKANLKIGAYGMGEKPCLDSLYYENADATGWASEGNGVWSKVIGTPSATDHKVKRLFVGAYNNGVTRADRSVGVGMRRAKGATADNLTSIKANLNADDIWWPAGSALGWKTYVYTGSDTIAPPQFYGGLAMLVSDQATIGAPVGLQVQGTQNILIEDIEQWGAATFAFLVRSVTTEANLGPVRNITFRRCVAKYMYTGGFYAAPGAENNTTQRVEVSNVLYDACIGDCGTNPKEQEPSTLYTNLGGAMDMFAFFDTAKDCRGVNCVSINSGHVGFSLGAYTQNWLLTDNCGYENCIAYYDSWQTYGRGFTTYNCTDSCYIRRCLFDGQNVRSQGAGGAYITSNIWVNMRQSVRKSGVSQVMCVAAEILDRQQTGIGNERYVYSVPTNLRIHNNLFMDPVDTAIVFENFVYAYPVAQPAIPAGSVSLANNVLFDRMTGDKEWLWTIERNGPIGEQKIKNNAVYKGEGKATPRTRRTNVSNATTYFDLNTEPGVVANIAVDPQITLDASFNPVLKRNSPLRRAGAFVGQFRDAKGRPFMIPPSIGPLEFTAGVFRAP